MLYFFRIFGPEGPNIHIYQKICINIKVRDHHISGFKNHSLCTCSLNMLPDKFHSLLAGYLGIIS